MNMVYQLLQGGSKWELVAFFFVFGKQESSESFSHAGD